MTLQEQIIRLEADSFRVIRRNVHNFLNQEKNSDLTIGAYVRGVCDLESEVYSKLLEDSNANSKDNLED